MKSTTRSDSLPLDAGQARRSLLMATIGTVTIVASVLYAPWSQSGPVLCPLRLLTGLPCPGCGLTRSFCAMIHGDLQHAVTFHLLGPALFLAVIAGIPILFYQATTRRRISWWDRLLYSRRSGYLMAFALFAYHAVRLTMETLNGGLWRGMQASLVAKAWHTLVG